MQEEMSVDDIRTALLNLAPVLPPIELPLSDAHGTTLAQDVFDGDRLVMKKDSAIRSVHIGIAAALGLNSLLTRPNPRVVVISAGDELKEPGQPLLERHFQYEVNSWMLTTMARESGAIGYRVHSIPQTEEHLQNIIEDQLVRADLLIISGEQHDESFELISSVLHKLGEVQVVKPKLVDGGKYCFGKIGIEKTPVLALPGNPLSAYIGAEIFMRPMIKSMLGSKRLNRTILHATLSKPIESHDGMHAFVRAKVNSSSTGVLATPIDKQNGLESVLPADGLISIPEKVTKLAEGDKVEVLILERGL